VEKKELIQIYTLAKILWANYKMPDSKFEIEMHNAVWLELLKDYDIKLIVEAMKEYSKQSEFLNIGKVAQKCQDITNASNPQMAKLETDYISEIEKSLRGNSFQAKESFETLSPIAKRIVGHAWSLQEWAMLSQYQWEQVVNRLSPSIKKLIEQENNTKLSLQIEGKETLLEQPKIFSREYTKQQLDALIDNPQDIDF